MDAVVVATRLGTLKFNAGALRSWLCLKYGNTDDWDGGCFCLLALTGAVGTPDHAHDTLAAVPDLDDLELKRRVSVCFVGQLI